MCGTEANVPELISPEEEKQGSDASETASPDFGGPSGRKAKVSVVALSHGKKGANKAHEQSVGGSKAQTSAANDKNLKVDKPTILKLMPGPTKCNCSKTKCLKLYCECFAKGSHCGEECACSNCCNLLG